MEENKNKDNKKMDRVGLILMLFHLVFVVAAICLVIRIIYIQCFYEPDPVLKNVVTTQVKKDIIEPHRGSIFSHDRRLLASSIPVYQVYMDCTVPKYGNPKTEAEIKKADIKEQEWIADAEKLAIGLAEIYGDRTAKEYETLIKSGRLNNKQYLKIGYEIEHETLLKVKQLPLFCKGKRGGGFIVETIDRRKYPYQSLARRVIGYVKNNNDPKVNSRIGIEGKYNYVLHGEEGYDWLKRTDANGWIKDYDGTSVPVKDGKDIVTTLDIDIQDIAEKALKKRLSELDHAEGGCAIVMEVETGKIRAMVNLKKDDKGNLGETYNYAIGRSGDPGSVFKLATMMTLIEDGHINLETRVPTYNGYWSYAGKEFKDEYLHGKGPDISVIDGFKISSNNVFRYLACKYYENTPKRFVDKLYEYKLGEAFDFDLEGFARPEIVSPDSPVWSKTALPSMAIGYTVTVTPLHIITFYNAVANKGKMMKPYLVEAFEKDGKVTDEFKPVILNGSICSKATADTLKRALRKVVTDGTGRGLKDAKCEVVGKTGTAQIPFRPAGSKSSVYKDSQGNRQHQATFVGFFPADNPKYTAIVVMYSVLGQKNLYGAAGIPAFKEIVDNIYTLDPEWGEGIKKKGTMPIMKNKAVNSSIYGLDEVPDVIGMGLKDAIYTIENSGYVCKFEGLGQVSRQEPAAGENVPKGSKVTLYLDLGKNETEKDDTK